MSEKNTKATENVEIDPGMSVMPEEPGLMDVPTVIPELDSMLAAMPTALPAYQTTVWKNKPSTETPVDAAVMTRVEQRLVDLTNAVNGLRDSVYRAPLAGTKAITMSTNKAKVTFNSGGGHRCFFAFSSGNGSPWLVLYMQDTVTSNTQKLGSVTVEKNDENSCTITAAQWSQVILIPIIGSVDVVAI